MMYYLILSWKDALEQMIEEESTLEQLRCPLCSECFDTHDYIHAIKHLKTCYTTRRVKNELFRNQHMSRRERLISVGTVADSVEREINRYLNDSSSEYHLW
jgi:hypothetical protein